MRLILKIAAGVFLGIAAVFVVMWALGRFERAKQKADKIAEAKNFADQAAPYFKLTELADLTPDVLVARCGKPIKDEVNIDAPKLLSRTMTYRVSSHREIAIVFCQHCGARVASDVDKWRLSSFLSVQYSPPRVDGALTGFGEQAAIQAMGCLRAKQ